MCTVCTHPAAAVTEMLMFSSTLVGLMLSREEITVMTRTLTDSRVEPRDHAPWEEPVHFRKSFFSGFLCIKILIHVSPLILYIYNYLYIYSYINIHIFRVSINLSLHISLNKQILELILHIWSSFSFCVVICFFVFVVLIRLFVSLSCPFPLPASLCLSVLYFRGSQTFLVVEYTVLCHQSVIS